MLVRNLIDCASKGGNYLLNIGPTSEGLFPQPSVERLNEIGQWMKINSESIYETTASPFKHLTWGRCTRKVTNAGATLYLHVFDWPNDGRIEVPGLKNTVESATLLRDGTRVSTVSSPAGVTILVPEAAPDAFASVVVLRVKGSLNIE
jgi:alpha-L-fucosidase